MQHFTAQAVGWCLYEKPPQEVVCFTWAPLFFLNLIQKISQRNNCRRKGTEFMFRKPLEGAEKGLRQGDDHTNRQASNNLMYTSCALQWEYVWKYLTFLP